MAIVEGQKVKVKWSGSNKKNYINHGYEFTKIGDTLVVDVKHVSKGSKWIVEASCDFCGETFKREMHLLNRRKHHYCCHECSVKHHSVLAAKTATYKDCEECGESYRTIKYYEGTSRFCSAKCVNKWRSREFKGKNNPRYKERIEVPCGWCSKSVFRLGSELKVKKNVFCSKECQNNYHGKVYMQREDIKEKNRATMLNTLSEGKIPSTATSIHNKVVWMLQEMNIVFEEEYVVDDVYIFDIYLKDYDLYIEVNGEFWHCDHRCYEFIQYDQQLNRILNDKRKRTYLKNNHNKNVLYLWEREINEDHKLCKSLISLFINSHGTLNDYNSFNYFMHYDDIYLNSSLEKAYIDWEYKDLANIINMEVRERKTTYRKDNYVTFNCDYCGKECEQRKLQYERSKKHFCDNNCRTNYGRVDYECDYCGTGFKIPRHRFEAFKNGEQNSICCSRECGDKYFSENYSGKNNPNYSRIEKTCLYCKNEYTVANGRKNNSKYCSPECSQKSQRNRVELPCDNCGETILKTPSQLKKTKNYFCSNKCADTYRSKNAYEERECIICNESFTVRKKLKTKMCSIECQGVWQSKNLRGKKANNYRHGDSMTVV